MKSEYDSIISLGGFCGAASQMRARGLRPCSYPLDWVFMDGPESIEWLATAFANGFADFALRENLVPIERDGVGGLAPFKYKDLASGYCFIHHFWRSIDDGDGYAEFSLTMRRRIKRMLSCFSPGKSVLLILATIFPFERALAEKLLCAIREMFPKAEIDMHVMQFNVAFDSPQVESERWPDGALQGVWASGNGRLVFGSHIACGDQLRIFTRNHNYESTRLPFDSTYVAKDVFIDDYVWIGAQVILLPGTHIHEGAIIQAGSVVHGDIPACAIAGGNPAKVFAHRDIERFNRLKAEYEAGRL